MATTPKAVARAGAAQEAHQLATVRGAHVTHERTQAAVRAALHANAEEKVQARAIDLITQELERPLPTVAPTAAATPSTIAPQSPTLAPPPPPTGAGPTGSVERREVRAGAAQAVALIEKIEVYVKAGRPAMALGLHGSLGARVEIERVGRGQVALRLLGAKTPPTRETLKQLRAELAARGLEVRSLSVA